MQRGRQEEEERSACGMREKGVRKAQRERTLEQRREKAWTHVAFCSSPFSRMICTTSVSLCVLKVLSSYIGERSEQGRALRGESGGERREEDEKRKRGQTGRAGEREGDKRKERRRRRGTSVSVVLSMALPPALPPAHAPLASRLSRLPTHLLLARLAHDALRAGARGEDLECVDDVCEGNCRVTALPLLVLLAVDDDLEELGGLDGRLVHDLVECLGHDERGLETKVSGARAVKQRRRTYVGVVWCVAEGGVVVERQRPCAARRMPLDELAWTRLRASKGSLVSCLPQRQAGPRGGAASALVTGPTTRQQMTTAARPRRRGGGARCCAGTAWASAVEACLGTRNTTLASTAHSLSRFLPLAASMRAAVTLSRRFSHCDCLLKLEASAVAG